jgi:hypothetical protein
MWRHRTPEDDIAKREGTNVLKVNASIQRVLTYMRSHSIEILTAKVHEVVLDQLPAVNQVITELTQATKSRTVTEKYPDGKGGMLTIVREVGEIDYRTRKSAIDALSKLRDMVVSKEVKTDINFGNQNYNLQIVSRSFEDRVRKKREAHGLQNQAPEQIAVDPNAPDDDPDIADAEFEDPVDDHEDSPA